MHRARSADGDLGRAFSGQRRPSSSRGKVCVGRFDDFAAGLHTADAGCTRPNSLKARLMLTAHRNTISGIHPAIFVAGVPVGFPLRRRIPPQASDFRARRGGDQGTPWHAQAQIARVVLVAQAPSRRQYSGVSNTLADMSRGLDSSVHVSIPIRVGSAPGEERAACAAPAILLRSRSNCTSVGTWLK